MNHTACLRLAAVLAIAAGALTLSNCATRRLESLGNFSLNYDPPAYRAKNPANVQVKISTGAQRMYVVEGSRVLLATPCTVGMQNKTPMGNFRVYSKEAKRRSHSFGDYPMPYWMEFAPAYGMHWGFVKPYPCTHGCVRLPKWAAAKAFALVPVNAPVNISHAQSEDATVGVHLPLLDDSKLPDPPASYMMSDRVFQDAVYKGQMFVD